jgi:hypothetical protein
MKRVIAFTALLVAAVATLASAQSTGATPSTKPLAEVAKAEEARRKSVRKPAKVYTNGSLKPDISSGTGTAVSTPAASPADGTATAATTPGTSPAEPAADADPAADKGQAYWAGRMKAARSAVERSQIFADSLQTRINSLKTDFVNRDDPAQKSKIEQDLNRSLAELARVQKEVLAQTKAITDLEDEARRAGVPPGWLR